MFYQQCFGLVTVGTGFVKKSWPLSPLACSQLQAQMEMLTIKYDLFSNQYLGVKNWNFKGLSMLAICAKWISTFRMWEILCLEFEESDNKLHFNWRFSAYTELTEIYQGEVPVPAFCSISLHQDLLSLWICWQILWFFLINGAPWRMDQLPQKSCAILPKFHLSHWWGPMLSGGEFVSSPL